MLSLAAARRYAELNPAAIAIVFSQVGRIRYVAPSRECPRLQNLRDSQLPPGAVPADGEDSRTQAEPTWIDLDPQDWLRDPFQGELTLETLTQRDGYAISILHVDGEDEPSEN